MGALDWSPIPAQNSITDPTIAARDGASAREYPSLARGIMAGVAALAADQGGALVSTGTDNVYDVATMSGVTRLQPGTMLSFWANRDNTAEPTLNVDGTGPRRWLGADGLPLPAGSIQGGLLYTVAWAAALAGFAPAWRLAAGGGAGVATTGIAFDFSGAPSDRALYDAQPKGKTFLAVADTPLGPSWVLYIKRSNGFADWSTGFPIKASPAQSTADAQAAADRAASDAASATERAATAISSAATAVAAASTSTSQAATATAGATVAADKAAVAVTQAAIATEGASTASSKAAIAVEKAAIAEEARLASLAAAAATASDQAKTSANRTAVQAAAVTVAIAQTGAVSAAADARAYAAQIGIQAFDFSFDSNASPTDDWSN